MKAAVLHEVDQIDRAPLSIEDVPMPEPGPGHVRIAVRCCGVCRTDLHVIEGELDQSRQKSPLIPGHQVVGTIDALGDGVTDLRVGDRVGAAWLGGTCGRCEYCTSSRQNLCANATFTGWMTDGGYAEYMLARGDYVYPLPDDLDDLQVAPLLCAGIIGYRCLRRCAIDDWNGARLGIYGFGAAGHIAIQIARHRGAEVYVCTRDTEKHQPLARELGAAWVGGATDQPPVTLHASIIFAPAGNIVPPALKALERGGRVVLGGIHMSPIPEIDYRDLYWEREIVSVANNTRDDVREFLDEAGAADVQTSVQQYPLEKANDALNDLKNDAIRGAAVLTIQND